MKTFNQQDDLRSLIVMKKYDINQYENDVLNIGLEKTWNNILNYLKLSKEYEVSYEFLNTETFGELYELGLAIQNKENKKELGKYFTPKDVSDLMSDWLITLDGEIVCDVCCGTGNLIISYLGKLGYENARKQIIDKGVYLYDNDELALKIAFETICYLYDIKPFENANLRCFAGDFLDRNIILPENAKVISNPPYYKITNINSNWNKTANMLKSKEFYSSIMEKILKQSDSSVIITPYSFVGGNKFSELRNVMSDNSGFVVSFDNVPGNIFNGRKYGVFNSNSTNSVRAAITVSNKNSEHKGYRISPLIRFKNEEREELLKTDVLKKTLPNEYQTGKQPYYKNQQNLETLIKIWKNNSNQKLSDYLKDYGEYTICVPNTCRYFTVATLKDLDRVGKYTLFFENEIDRDIIYGFINSSFAYWWWRMYDGGITYPKNLLCSLPVFIELIKEKDNAPLLEQIHKMQKDEMNHLSYKQNAGKEQENVKFEQEDIYKLDELFCNILNYEDFEQLKSLHKNCFFQGE